MFKQRRELNSANEIPADAGKVPDQPGSAPIGQHKPIALGGFYMAKPRVFVHGVAIEEQPAPEAETKLPAGVH